MDIECSNCSTVIDAPPGVEHTSCPSCGSQVMVPAPGIVPGAEFGVYTIVRRLGAGGMGEVFEAHHARMDRRVALKVLSPAMVHDPKALDRFLNEVRLAARLQHPNIVVAFDAGDVDGIYYLAMACIDGSPLDSLLKSGPMPEPLVLDVAEAVANALDYAWREHLMLHRDIKPGNIMIDRNDHIHLLDMGVAKTLREESLLTIEGTLVGTPNYMSPEQARSQADLDCRADIYSLGATMYHLLTAKVPFDAPSVMAVLAHVLSRDGLPAVRGQNPDVSQACSDLVASLTARYADDRPQTWADVVAELQAIRRQAQSSATSADLPMPKQAGPKPPVDTTAPGSDDPMPSFTGKSPLAAPSALPKGRPQPVGSPPPNRPRAGAAPPPAPSRPAVGPAAPAVPPAPAPLPIEQPPPARPPRLTVEPEPPPGKPLNPGAAPGWVIGAIAAAILGTLILIAVYAIFGWF